MKIIKDRNGKTLSLNNKVYWNDPENISSEFYYIDEIVNEEIIKMSNEYSYCEAMANELIKC